MPTPPSAAPSPVCLACGTAFPRAAAEARPKLTCSGACRGFLARVLSAASPATARRLLCERYPHAPKGHVARVLEYRAAAAARRRAGRRIEWAANRLAFDRRARGPGR